VCLKAIAPGQKPTDDDRLRLRTEKGKPASLVVLYRPVPQREEPIHLVRTVVDCPINSGSPLEVVSAFGYHMSVFVSLSSPILPKNRNLVQKRNIRLMMV
jgi:hypothetical protein